MDWSVGEYELTARQLLPASQLAVSICSPTPTETIVDLGCGSGNATLLLARTGAHVIAVDPAERLLGVAEELIGQNGLETVFLMATAEDLPIPDGSVDALVSVFALIFSTNPARAAAEIARVLKPDARVVIAAWIPEGPLFKIGVLQRQFMSRANPQLASPPPPFPWADGSAVSSLFAPYGFSLAETRHSLAFSAESARVMALEQSASNPLALVARRVVEPVGLLDELIDEVTKILDDANEDKRALKVTSPFVIYELTRESADGGRQ